MSEDKINYDITRVTIRNSNPNNSEDLQKMMRVAFDNLRSLREDPDLSIKDVHFIMSKVDEDLSLTDCTCELFPCKLSPFKK